VSDYVEVQGRPGQPEGDQDYGQEQGRKVEGSCGGQEVLTSAAAIMTIINKEIWLKAKSPFLFKIYFNNTK
jgi:hypothetical protein